MLTAALSVLYKGDKQPGAAVTRLQHTARVLWVVGHHERHGAPVACPQRAVAARVDRVRGRRPAQSVHLRQIAQQPGRPCACVLWPVLDYISAS